MRRQIIYFSTEQLCVLPENSALLFILFIIYLLLLLLLQRCIQNASLRPGMHSFSCWTQRMLNEGSNWTRKKNRVYANYKLQEQKTQPRSQGLSSSRPLERERDEDGGREEERPWERGCKKQRHTICKFVFRENNFYQLIGSSRSISLWIFRLRLKSHCVFLSLSSVTRAYLVMFQFQRVAWHYPSCC